MPGRLMESDPRILCSLHPHVGLSNPFITLKPQPLFELQRQPWFEDFPVDASIHKYKKRQQQQQHGSNFKPTSRADEGRRMKMKMGREITDSNNNDSSGKISNASSSSLYKQPQPNGGGGGDRSPRAGFDPQTNGLYKTSTKGPSLPPQPGFDPQANYEFYKTSPRGPSLPPRQSANEKEVVNWRLACFMCNEYLTYLTRGTLMRTEMRAEERKRDSIIRSPIFSKRATSISPA